MAGLEQSQLPGPLGSIPGSGYVCMPLANALAFCVPQCTPLQLVIRAPVFVNALKH